MKKHTLLVVLMVICAAAAVHGQGFAGPGANAGAGTVQTVTVSQAKTLPDNTLVILTGSITAAIGREKFTFRDATGDITIKIDRNLWVLLDVSAGPNEPVEIRGELDVEKRATEVEVKFIKKI